MTMLASTIQVQPDMSSLTPRQLIPRLQADISAVLKPLMSDARPALVDFPNHGNVGDSAIWLGEIAFLAREMGTRPAYTCSTATFSADDLRRRAPDGPILIHGGGNFGTIWRHHHQLRLDVLRYFPRRPIIQLPQSIHFDDDEAIRETADAIRRHGAFTLLVRDRKSFGFAQEHFDCPVHLCPDMAFCMGPFSRLRPIVDFLCLMRTDAERVSGMTIPDDASSRIVVDWLEESRQDLRRTRLFARFGAVWRGEGISGHTPTVHDALAWRRFRRGVATLSQGKIVVTDRLHAHIISVLLGLPHVVLDNSYGKLGSFIDAWTSNCVGLERATNMAAAMERGRRLLVAGISGWR
ncbi:polysaccharide pyruvyl transferase family protein [Dongia sp.]|uniref:polysaccharide pyruvyl transferase family protein n=1 Tax=Dongia sp. TaxID=1977262 RepID=UPI0035B1FC4E